MVEIPFRRDLAFEYGKLQPISPLIRRVVARNPGPFTLHGTGTYVVGHGRVAVIDPGPALQEHIDALLHALRGETIEQILVTHTHLDHSPASAAVKQATAAPTHGYGPHAAGLGPAVEEGGDRAFVPDRVLREGDTVSGPGWHLTAVHTPGHTSNHLCFALAEERVLFSGDHVMGWSTSVIAPPDGNMRDYLRSLDKLLERDDATYWPTHGPAISDPKPFVRAFIEHRREREAAILHRLAEGDTEIPAMVRAIYVGLPPVLHGAAGRSVLAHLIELVADGRVETDGPPTVEGQYRLRSS
ncbi:MAG TPA: MBL fold metallo-hydrolase [Stellaceae bacterium]|nr:MBL fold metallo-hydrolase [Stellaceae bacterium]